MKKEFLSYWMLFVIVLFLVGIATLFPLFPVPLAILIGAILFIVAKKKDWLKPFRFFDLIMIMFSSFFFLIVGLSLGIIALIVVPWWKLILLGLIASAVMWAGDFIPIIGDFISAVIVLLLSIFVIGGLSGMIIGGIIFFIALIPFTFALGWLNFFAVAIFLIIFKLLSMLIAGAIGALI